MNFATAIRQLNDGKLMARPHWPAGCYVGLAIGAVNGLPRTFLVARGEGGSRAPWLAEPHDIAAEDWREPVSVTGEMAQSARRRRIEAMPDE